MSTLSKLLAREVFDSRGRPTIEVEVLSSSGASGRAAAPSGLAPGRFEARELRDHHQPRLGGFGVRQAIDLVRSQVAPALSGFELDDQRGLDDALIALDGTPDRHRLGANTLLAVSLASASANASARDEPLCLLVNRLWRQRLDPHEVADPLLPMPSVSMISAARRRDAPTDFHTFLMVPLAARSFSEALEIVADLRRCLAEVLIDYGDDCPLVADDGAYAPILRTDGHAIEQILESGLRCGLKIDQDVAVALDVAAARFHDPNSGLYLLPGSRESLETPEMIALVEHWARQYPIVSVEDPLAPDDWTGWSTLTDRLGPSLQLVGDDLFDSQPSRLQEGARHHAANALIVKPNQLGTLSETLDLLRLAHQHHYRPILSARSGETEDTLLADLAVGTACGQVKFGSVARSERLAKYNRLLRIEETHGFAFADRHRLALRQTSPAPKS